MLFYDVQDGSFQFLFVLAREGNPHAVLDVFVEVRRKSRGRVSKHPLADSNMPKGALQKPGFSQPSYVPSHDHQIRITCDKADLFCTCN